jgi:hypothetical protein
MTSCPGPGTGKRCAAQVRTSNDLQWQLLLAQRAGHPARAIEFQGGVVLEVGEERKHVLDGLLIITVFSKVATSRSSPRTPRAYPPSRHRAETLEPWDHG